MEIGVGAVIFIVMVVFSLAKQYQESRKKSEQVREREPQGRANLPDATRRILHGETGVREAKPRTAPGPRQKTPRQAEPLAPGRQLLESLLGVSSERESEGDWVSVQEQEPAPLRELPQRGGPQREGPQREGPGRVEGVRQTPDATRRPTPPAAPRQAPQQAPRQAPVQAPTPAPRRRSAAPERPQRTRPKAAPTKRRPAAVQAALRRAAQPAHRYRTIFGDIREVRKAIVFAEILGPPRAFADLQGGPQ